MIKISKQNNSLIVEGIDNVFYPNNGDNSYPLNSLIVVTDNSDMATFRSVATNDVLFSGLINNITINGEAVTKDNIIQKFDAVSNSSTGGGGGGTVDAYTKEEADGKFATKSELTNVQTVANDADTKVDALTTRVEGVETTLGNKQDTLVSGTNIKTINNQSILGEGNIEISDYYTKTEADEIFATTTQVNHQAADIAALQTDMRGKQATLVSGENIKTINGESVLGEGNIEVAKKTDIPSTDNLATKDELTAVETVANNADTKADAATSRVESVETALNNKQDTLVSGTNIKTINSESILGTGDIQINADAKVVNIGSGTPFTKLYDLLHKAVSALNNGTDYNETSYSFNETINQQYLDFFKTLKNGDLLSQYDTIFGDMFKVECNPFYFNTSESTNNFNILIKYLGYFNVPQKFINYTRDIRVYVYFDRSRSSGEILEVELQVHTQNSGPALQKNDFKTINGESLIGEGNIEVSGVSEEQAQEIAKIPTLETNMMGKQDTLVSGTNIKTINGNSILGEGNLVIEGGGIDLSNYYNKTEVDTKLDTKQNTLVSGTNIKTVNSQSILGEGNIEVTIPDATTATSGAMSAADKTKLDSMSNEWTGTQAEYDALTTKDDNIIYYVTE